MSVETTDEKQMVFGLDIGTRNVVGTVGYQDGKQFIVVAQCVREHETRAMLDGQIHDIGRVSRVIREVKEVLETQIGKPLTDVCIAAAGRVLKTVTTTVEYEFPEETVVTDEDIHTLDLLGVEKAQSILQEKNDTKYRFYCVGYSTVKYYLNDEIFSNLESHKAEKIAEEIIVTFLPEDVVDGLYAAVGQAGLNVANLTLEPIAAINVAIPENFRMLNIALVDVGAGTSDISITKDGSIIAYGMIPQAGDELTEVIVQHYLVDFQMAEHMKLASGSADEVTYEDIMSISHTIKSEEIWDLTAPIVDRITTEVSSKIKELNGDKSVSATFIVGGGGKIHGFAEAIADKLEIARERVALRGEEVLKEVIFEQEEIVKDPLLVTPIGICLNYYDQKNNFIMVHFNGERIKLYDNNRLTIVDAALQAGFPKEELFPRRGKEIHFTVNGRPRVVRGEAGEAAVVTLNDKPANINTPITPNCDITITSSTVGGDAVYTVERLNEYQDATISLWVNGKYITCPRFVEVNGILEAPSYEIKENDRIETRSYYTLEQLAEFMDVEVDMDRDILVNNKDATMETLVYENFEVEWTVVPYASLDPESKTSDTDSITSDADSTQRDDAKSNDTPENISSEGTASENVASEETNSNDASVSQAEINGQSQTASAIGDIRPKEGYAVNMTVFVNHEPVALTGKSNYLFVDLFDVIDFDLTQSHGRAIVTTRNGHTVQYTEELAEGDQIEIYWKEIKK